MSGAGHVHGPECLDLLVRLSEYLDGELPLEACRDVEGHLADCGRCREFLESLRRTVAWIEREPGPSLPEDLKREIVDAWARLQEGKEGGS